MNDRISLVLRTKNISPSVLADELGVQRSGISHILNGRNKPSLDFIQKLIKLYPDISIQWILFGEGPMMNPYPAEKTDNRPLTSTMISADKNKHTMPDLFNMQEEVKEAASDSQEGKIAEDEFQYVDKQIDTASDVNTDFPDRKVEPSDVVMDRLTGSDHPEALPVHPVKKKEKPVIFPQDETGSPKTEKPARKISKIVVFYTDRTFVEYNPGSDED
jgi:transcriptional regulator with XRE-family HTH domain